MKRRVLALVLVLVMVLPTFSLAAFAEDESNDSKSSANSFELNGTVKGYLSSIDDEDWFKITVPGDGRLWLSIRSSGKGGIVTYHFWRVVFSDESGTSLIQGKHNIEGSTAYEQKGMSNELGACYVSAGDYYVKVSFESSMSGVTSSDIAPKYTYTLKNEYICSHKNTTEEILSDPTCSQEGEVQYICDDCGEIASKKPIDKLPHTPDGNWVTVKEPTCSEAGKRTQTCTVCGQTAQEETLKRLEHTYGDWEVIKKATCSENGEERRFCSVCGTGDSHPIIFGDHDFGEWEVTKKATCDTAGSRTRKCLLCGKEERETDPRLEHDFSGWTTVEEKTCLKDGSEERVCRLCGKKETRTLEAEGHDYGPWVREGEMEVQTCSVCGKKERKEAGSEQVLASYLGAVDSEYMTLRAIHFADVAETSWYHQDVRYAYSLGIMQGNSDTIFNPAGNMTLAEAITMAARVYKKYCLYGNPYPDSEEFPPTKVWYETYVNYAIRNGIIKADSFDDYERPATRAEMAYIFTNAAMEDEYKKEFRLRSINTVEKLPDVQETDRYGKEIFTLYRAGVLTGQDKQGTFSPDSPITRAEAAAIITRVALKNMRKTLELK